MVIISLDGDDIVVRFNYFPEYVKRIKSVPGARYSGDGTWRLPKRSLDSLEVAFKGSIVWSVPRHVILGEPPPPLPEWYAALPDSGDLQCFKRQVFPYQWKAAHFVRDRVNRYGYAFICDGTGMGKSVEAIAAVELMRENGELPDGPVGVLCLGSLKTQWHRDVIESFTTRKSVLVKGTKEKRSSLYQLAAQRDYVIFNYELLLQDFDEISSLDMSLLIIDEPHERVLGRHGKMHKLISKLDVPRKIILTATPIVTGPEDVYSLWEFCDPSYLGKVTAFRERYIIEFWNGRYRQLVGYQNLDELEEKISPFIMARTPEQVGLKLPSVHWETIKVELAESQRQMLARLADIRSEIIGSMTTAKGRALEHLSNRLLSTYMAEVMVTGVPAALAQSESEDFRDLAKLSDGKSPKLNTLLEICREISSRGEKAVIFCATKAGVDAIVSALDGAIPFTGDLSPDAKDDAVTAFTTLPGVRFFVSTDAGQNGLNLQVAPYVINFDIPWTAKDMEQRIGRIRRVGAPYSQILVYNLVAPGTVDEMAMKAVERRSTLQSALIKFDS